MAAREAEEEATTQRRRATYISSPTRRGNESADLMSRVPMECRLLSQARKPDAGRSAEENNHEINLGHIC